MSGFLYLVATPIGNYEDITYRATRILKEVDLILIEERSEGIRFLNHLGLAKQNWLTFNEHNEQSQTPEILRLLTEGKNVALISDAGTPVFSDPGGILVKSAIKAGIKLVPIPGASAVLPALVASGFPIGRFLFYGWLSPKTEQRVEELRGLRRETRTIVLLDTPYRLIPLLRDVSAVLGTARRVVVAFNISMADEEYFRGTAGELFERFGKEKRKGEFVLVIKGDEE